MPAVFVYAWMMERWPDPDEDSFHIHIVDIDRRRVVLRHEVAAQSRPVRLDPDGIVCHVQPAGGPEKDRDLMQGTAVGEIDQVHPAKPEWWPIRVLTQLRHARAQHPAAADVFAVLIIQIV